MKSEEEEEDHKEDLRKLVEMMQKEEAEQQEQGGNGLLAPNMGAGGSHPQVTSDLQEGRKEQEQEGK